MTRLRNFEWGFLIVKTFPKLYRDYAERYKLSRDIYAVPRIDRGPQDCKVQYRGLGRDALDPYENSEIRAEVRMLELERDARCEDGFLFDFADVQDVLRLLEDRPDYEVIWTRIAHSLAPPPKGYHLVGYEPSYFSDDHFSASCDCMLFPRWHGTDEEGTLFTAYFQKLNQYGLFSSEQEARDFLRYYLSFDWTETGEYEIAEVFAEISGA
jgi:hypothetical protein